MPGVFKMLSNMKLNCLIVDDEPMARDLLKRYVRDVPALYLAGECSNAFEASEALMDREIHLMFLDINMPRLSGMKFYRSLASPPAVIFTTAYPEYALEGFEVDAVDYLLKPFSFERFYKAVNRVMEKFREEPEPALGDFILLRADKKIHRVKLSDIRFIQGLGDYIKVKVGGEFLIVHDTLRNILETLPDSFIRTHKSWVVSVQHIEYIEGNTVLMGKDEIPIGLKYKEEFLAALEKKG